MRILQVSPYYPPHIGGIEFHVEALSRKLVEAGHEVVVYTSNVPRSKRYEVINGVEIHRFTSLASPLNNPVMPGMFLKLLGGSKFDVIHAHGYLHISSNLTAFRNILKRRSPFVLTSHGAILGYRGWRGTIETLYHRTGGKWTLRTADRIIALSTTQADILEGLGADRRRVVVIPLWMDKDYFHLRGGEKDFRDTYQLGSRKIVLFVGGLQPRKGLRYLIEAAKLLRSDPTIAIVGDEPSGYAGSKQALEQQVSELGLEGKVLFLGSFPREYLGGVYNAADLFVLPSLAEGLPTVLLEAMSHGRCVLATDIPGNRDLVKDEWNGLLVEPRNSGELSRKIDYLLSDNELRERLGTQARQDIEQNYSPDSVLTKILDLYREVQKT